MPPPMPCLRRPLVAIIALLAIPVAPAWAQQLSRPPLTSPELDAIAQLLQLEDTRQFDEPALSRLLKSAHPEVKRRAVQAVARIANPAGRALLLPLRTDPDPEIVATVAFAAGQLKDPDSVPWLSQILSSVDTAPPIGREAAQALGKIRSPEARAALARYLAAAPTSAGAAPVVGEALLAIGRFTTREDLSPIVRWVTVKDPEIRWRAAWALFRPRDPAAVQHLLKLTEDPSPEVRFWAMRGLAPALVTEAGLDIARTAARLRDAVRDPDRRVRAEALRSLVLYDDDASFAVVMEAVDSADTWLSVSAAESLGRFKARADVVVPRLASAGGAARPTWLRTAVLASLLALAPDAAVPVAVSLARDSSAVTRATAVQALSKLGDAGGAALDQLAADPKTKDLIPQPGAKPAPRPPAAKRTEAEYRAVVERWILTDYQGRAKPRAALTTPRGEIEVELYPGDAPLGIEAFIAFVESGSIVGTEFGRVVPNFVAQQRPIRTAVTLRDEVSRRGLTRGNVSWASAGLDTGRPGYTFGMTPQPHNEGDFTALGRVIRGLEVMDRLELGDAITGARMVR
jgi:HEAT repeat protein/cyclophilin family peptidyl-prolyl cis-trans isomerase